MKAMLLLPGIAAYAQLFACRDTWFKTILAQFCKKKNCEIGAQATKAV